MALCRLCLSEGQQTIAIFGAEGRDQNVPNILSEFIWFQIVESDAISTAVCRKCWLSLSTFHEFIASIKFAQLQLQQHADYLACGHDDDKLEVFATGDGASTSTSADMIRLKSKTPPDKNVPIMGSVELKIELSDANIDESIDDEASRMASGYGSVGVKNADCMIATLPEFDSDAPSDGLQQNHVGSCAGEGSDAGQWDANADEDGVDLEDGDRAANEDEDEDDEEDDEDDNDDDDDDDDYDADEDYNEQPPSPKRKPSSTTAGGQKSPPKPRNKRKNTSAEDDALIRSMCALKCANCPAHPPDGSGGDGSEPFETFGDLERHYRVEHNAVGFVMCCGRKLTKRHRLLDHIQSHLNPDAFKCTVCAARFSGSFPLKRHMVTHVPDEKRRFACADCPKRYTNAVQLSRHQINKHSGDMEKRFACAVCQRMYLTDEKLTAHVKRSHNDDMVPHICDYCGKEFRSISNLNKHRKDVHSGQERARKQCTVCGTWLSEFYLRRHMRQHNNAKVETCTVCGKTLQNKNTLANHMRYVHGSRRHRCTLCEKSFTKPMSLREHMAVHTGKDLYTCSYCPKTFKSDSNMYSHQKKSHVEEWTRDRGKRLEAKNTPP